MTIVDGILIAFTVIMALAGWRSGFVRSAGSLVALIASIAVAFYGMNWLRETYGLSLVDHPWFTIVGFLLLTLIVSRIAQYLVNALDLVRKIVAILPFVNLFNSILGAAFGVAQAAVAIAIFAYTAVTFVPVGELRTTLLLSQIMNRAIDIESTAGIL